MTSIVENCDGCRITFFQEDPPAEFVPPEHLSEHGYRAIACVSQTLRSMVVRARDVLAEKDVAIKISKITTKDEKNASFSLWEKLNGITHPNIVSVRNFYVTEDSAVLVMNYIPNPTLEDTFCSKQRLTPLGLHRFLTDVTNACEFLHERRLDQKDLTPSNVHFGFEWPHTIISDFCSANGIANTRNGDIGSPGFAAPERYRKVAAAYTMQMLTYEVGALFFAVATGRKQWETKLWPLNDFTCLTTGEDYEFKQNKKIVNAALTKAFHYNPDCRFDNLFDLKDAFVDVFDLPPLTAEPGPYVTSRESAAFSQSI